MKKSVLTTPCELGLHGNYTVNMYDGFSLEPVLIGYINVGQAYKVNPFLYFYFPSVNTGLK